MVRAEVPDARATHRKPGHRDPLRIHDILAAHRVHRLKHIDLPGELCRVAVAAVRNDDDRVFGDELWRTGLTLGQEGEFGPLFTATEEPDHQAIRLLALPGRRDVEPVGLDRAVEDRAVSADHEAL